MRKPHLVSLVIGAAVCAAPITPAVAFAQPVAPSHTAVAKVSAKKLLNALHVKPEKHAATYKRSSFTLWIDADHDGEDTRAEVLRAQSLVPVVQTRSGSVRSGKWVSPYDGKTFTSASKLDIDHLVPLQEAWVSGASGWSSVKRTAYANDLGYASDLIAVSAHANRSKGDREPNGYLPARRSYRCSYVKSWVAVKYRWGLSVNASEKKALSKDLKKYCGSMTVSRPGKPNIARLTDLHSPAGAPGGPAPVASASATPTAMPTLSSTPIPAPVSTSTPAPQPTATPSPIVTATTPPPSGPDPDYGTCSNAKAHHAHTPYYRGIDPEYAYYQDRDGDGVVCE